MACAFMAKAAIPAGFMPGTDKNGMTALVICSGMGEKTVMVPADAPAPVQNDQTGPCDYFLSAAHKIIDVDIPLIPMADNPLLIAETVFKDTVLVAASISSISARGPPALV